MSVEKEQCDMYACKENATTFFKRVDYPALTKLCEKHAVAFRNNSSWKEVSRQEFKDLMKKR